MEQVDPASASSCPLLACFGALAAADDAEENREEALAGQSQGTCLAAKHYVLTKINDIATTIIYCCSHL